MEMEIVTFSVGSRTYKFKKPLMLEREESDELCLSHKELYLSASGKSWGECDKIIREQLAELWEDYALAPDDELSTPAIALKNKLLVMVEEANKEFD